MVSWSRSVVIVFGAILLAGRAGSQAGPIVSARTAIVLDFSNRAGPAGAGLERFAADAVAVELAGSGRYEVLKRSEVERATRELGLRAPYDKADVRRVARTLGADSVVSGEIAFLRKEEHAGTTRLRVGLKIRVMDPETGELISGASPVVVHESRR